MTNNTASQKPSIPPNEIRQFVTRRWGELDSFLQLAEGLSSQAFGFGHNNEEYVIRINSSIEGFAKDAYVSQKFNSAALPIPKVLDVGHLPDGPAFCISRRAAGVRLHDLDQAGLQRVVEPTCQIIQAIAGSDLSGTTGFGYFDSRGVAPCPSWHDFITSVSDPQRFAWEKVGTSMDREMVGNAIQLIQALSEYCPEERCLIHGDFGSYNALTDGERITAVIDWDLGLFGDPLYEVANLLFWGETQMAPVIERFAAMQAWPNTDRRLLCYQLRTGLREIYANATGQGPTFDSTWLLARERAIIAQAMERG